MEVQMNALTSVAMDFNIEISIAIIAKNEEQNIGHVLLSILNTVKRDNISSNEIFLVDGYSTDRTVDIADDHGIRVFRARGGKGSAIRMALELAKGKYVLFIDADGSHMVEDISRLLNTIKESKSDIVIVSRILGTSEELSLSSLDNILRLIGNKLSTYIVNLRWKVKLTDIQNGFRIVKRDSVLALNLAEDRFAIEQEMVMKCLRAHKQIAEIPGIERKRLHGKSKINKGREFWVYLWSLFKNI